MKFDDYRIDTQCQKGHFLPDLSLEELNNYFERTQVNFYNCIKHSMQFSSFVLIVKKIYVNYVKKKIIILIKLNILIIFLRVVTMRRKYKNQKISLRNLVLS